MKYHTYRYYYLTPDGPVAQKPYSLLLRAMHEQNRHAFAQIVFSNREQIVQVRPAGRLLMMDMINYAERVKAPAEFETEVVTADVAPAELNLAKALTEQLAMPDFKLDGYKDLYEERMAKLVEAKVQGKDIQFDALPQDTVDSPTNKDIPSQLVQVSAVTKSKIKDTVVADGIYKISQICTAAYKTACAEAGLK